MSDDLQYALAAEQVFKEESGLRLPEALGARLLFEFADAEKQRRLTEERWLRDLRQFKGQYDPEVLALIGPKRSKTFVRKTRVKVKTLDARVEDLLFPSGNDKNWELGPTPVPSVPQEVRARVVGELKQMMARQLAAQQQPGQPPVAQRPPTPTKEEVDKALLVICKESAKKMSKVIDDQLTEVAYKAVCKKAIHSCHLYGTGIVKGPLVERRVRSTFVHEGGKWVEKSETYAVPFIDYVPIWRFYPDMGADTLEKCRYVFERHHMTHADLAELAQRKTFDKKKIIDYLRSNPRGAVTFKYIDNQLKLIGERVANQGSEDGKYEILERWGWLSGEDLKAVGVKVPEDRLYESFFSNVWLLPNGDVIKAVLQPINGVTWPYHIYYLDKDETSIFGDGMASIMRDDQTNVNAAHRLMLDNGAATSGPMIEIATGLLSVMDSDVEIEPWRVFLRNSQNPGTPAVRSIDLPSRLNDLAGIADRFENNADEVSAIPRYMTGENVSSGAAGTSSGMSMLMGAANIMVKDQIGNWDEGITEPFIKALYRWNMQFNPDNSIKGDFDVKARGTSSLVAREIRAQQLDQFSAMVANPMDAPFIKRDKLLRQRAEAHELSDVVKTEDEVAAESNNEMAQMQQRMALQQAQLGMAELEKKVALLTAQAAKAAAEVELIMAKATSTKVEAVYSALQAGGVATGSPQIAPAGDEILRSSGWKDATPDPSIAQLDGMPVQQPNMPYPDVPGALERPAGAAQPGGAPADAQPQAPVDLKPQTGHVGQNAGIETPRIEG